MIILVAHRNGQYFDLLCIWSRPNNFLEYSIEIKFEYMCDSADLEKWGVLDNLHTTFLNSSTFDYSWGHEMPGEFSKISV